MTNDENGILVKEIYKSGDYIFLEGDVEKHFYIIEDGQVEIFTKNKLNQKIPVCIVEPGEAFGEFALLTQKPRSASARAISDVTVIRVSEEGYKKMLDGLPLWASSMMHSFVRRLRSITESLKDSDQFLGKL